MNLFDVLIVVALMAGAAWGFIKGVVHQAIGIGLIYLSLIVATLFYVSIAPGLGKLVKITPQAAGALAFLFLLIVTLNVLSLALRRVRQHEFKMLRLVNQLGGMSFGFLAASLWVALAIALMYYAIGGDVSWHQEGRPVLMTVGSASLQRGIVTGLNRSPLVWAFSQILPFILSSVSPFVPTSDILHIFVIS